MTLCRAYRLQQSELLNGTGWDLALWNATAIEFVEQTHG